MVKDNNLLGKFEITNIPPAPRGVPKIEVTFNVDENGIMNVSAVDQSTGQEEALTVMANFGDLCKEDIDRMTKEIAQ